MICVSLTEVLIAQQRLEKQIISNSTLNFGIDSLELIHEQSAD